MVFCSDPCCHIFDHIQRLLCYVVLNMHISFYHTHYWTNMCGVLRQYMRFRGFTWHVCCKDSQNLMSWDELMCVPIFYLGFKFIFLKYAEMSHKLISILQKYFSCHQLFSITSIFWYFTGLQNTISICRWDENTSRTYFLTYAKSHLIPCEINFLSRNSKA